MSAVAGLLHFVGYRLAAGVAAEKTARVRDGFAGLSAAVPGASLVAIGPNVSHSAFAAGWDYAAVVAFTGPDALAAYIAHPLHLALGAETSSGFYDTCIVLDVPVLPAIQGDPS